MDYVEKRKQGRKRIFKKMLEENDKKERIYKSRSNFIPFLNKAPITDMFIMGFVCAIALVILLVILAKIISAKLQN